MVIDKAKRKVNESKIGYEETAEEVFTINLGCPHCKKTISISLAKLELLQLNTQEVKQNDKHTR
ncbi:MAG: hypothetical protein KKF54_04640 [Candidatus Omnitrophica bacterium]|nr:hypothetical protein [Candidatus Omnitrophota bacterium]